MLSFIVNKKAPEQIEIDADDKGINDLILYLQGIQKDKDHMHLVIDNELDNYPIAKEQADQVVVIKHVRLQYTSSEEWNP